MVTLHDTEVLLSMKAFITYTKDVLQNPPTTQIPAENYFPRKSPPSLPEPSYRREGKDHIFNLKK